MQQPVASQIRTAFFAIHLFREQMFSMSDNLEWYLVQFLRCNIKDCCTHTFEQRNEWKKTGQNNIRFSFLSWLCAIIADHGDPVTKKSEWESWKNKDKNMYRDDNWKVVMGILWRKFNDFRMAPNVKQVVKIDRGGERLKEFFLRKQLNANGGEMTDLEGNPLYDVDFKKILRVFPKVREIYYLNQYKFDDKALDQLVDILKRKKDDKRFKLRTLRFLYYDYPEGVDNEIMYKDTKLGIPIEGNTFCHPDTLDQSKKDELEE